MAEKEEPIANDETGKIKVKAKTEKQPDGNETEGNVTKVKAKMKKPAEIVEQTMTKVDLSKPVEETNVEEVVGETQPEEVSETPVLQEITEEQTAVEEIAEQAEEAIVKAEVTGEPLPENIQKLVSFMDETGGDLNDYVKLNQD